MPTLYNERVLVIEDESLIRFSLRARLTKDGYEVDEAEDVRTGLLKIETRNHYGVLSDAAFYVMAVC